MIEPKPPVITTLPRLATPEDTRACLTSRLVLTMPDVLLMGRIRHIQRASFSYDTTPIDDARQADWWRWNHNRINARLYDDHEGNTVGYGCLRQEADGRWYSSVAVLPNFGGHNYGRTILTHLVQSVDHDVWARARADNLPAMKLHDELLWEVLTHPDSQHVYYHTRPKVRAARLLVNLDHCGVLGQ